MFIQMSNTLLVDVSKIIAMEFNPKSNGESKIYAYSIELELMGECRKKFNYEAQTPTQIAEVNAVIDKIAEALSLDLEDKKIK